MRETRSRSVVTLDRAQLVGLGFFAVLSGGLMFGLGYSAGKVPRAEAPKAEPPVLAQIDAEHALHQKMKEDRVDLTFFNALVEKENKKPVAPIADKPVEKPAPVVVAEKPIEKPVEKPLPMPAALVEKEKDPTFASALAPTSAPEEPKIVEPKPVAAEKPVAKPVVVAEKPAPKAVAPKTGEFTIQVSAFKSEPEADVLASKLTQKGFKPIVTPLELQGKGTWYRVRVGHFSSQAAAETTKQKLEHENFPTWIVRAD